MFRRFGSQVTVVHRGPQILPREDADVVEELQKALEAEGVRFLLDARATHVERAGGGVALTVEAGEGIQTLPGSHLLVATGRRPNTDDLGLEKAGAQVDPPGYARANGRLG